MIEVTVKNKITGEVKTGSYTARELFDTMRKNLVTKLTRCDCQPVGEAFGVECN